MTIQFTTTPDTTGLWHGVFFDGPQADTNAAGDEIPVWVVYIGDDDAEPTGAVHRYYNYKAAEFYAHRMALDAHLDLIHDASPD